VIDIHAATVGFYEDVARNAIRWCSRTHNFFQGCTRVSEGCDNCYAIEAGVHQTVLHPNGGSPYHRLVVLTDGKEDWAGHAQPAKSTTWIEPFRTRQRWLAFADSMSDVFHKDISDDWLLLLFQTLHLARWHVWQVLTKRHKRMSSFMSRLGIRDGMLFLAPQPLPLREQVELENVWLGVTAETQERADQRIPELLKVKATVRFVSVEPLLEPVTLKSYLGEGIDWVIAGGESGPAVRPMDVAWARQSRDECIESPHTAFFFKQFSGKDPNHLPKELDGRRWEQLPMRPLFPVPDEAERRELILWATTQQAQLRARSGPPSIPSHPSSVGSP
jgi:protein gp37